MKRVVIVMALLTCLNVFASQQQVKISRGYFTGRDYFALLGFFFRTVGDDDAAANLLAFVNTFHDHAVM